MARIKSGYSVQDAARFLSIHKTTLQRYERGDCPVPQNLLPAISKLYHISPSSLFGLSETEYLFKKGFYIFYWQPSRASPHPEILSYMEAFSPAQEENLLFYFRCLDERARRQLLGLAILLFKGGKK